MNFVLKPLALAMFLTTAQIAGAAIAPARNGPAAPAVQPVTAKAPIPVKASDDWIVYDDVTYAPVVDAVSRHLDAARHAFDTKDNAKVAAELHTVADELKQQAVRAGNVDRALARKDLALAKADIGAARETATRIDAAALKIASVAAAVESGKIRTKAELDKAIDKAARADLDRRWLVTDVATWYQVSEEPQRHFTDAAAAYARKDYKAAAAEIRKANGYLRLEAGRASGAARQELDTSIAQLDALATSIEKGVVKNQEAMVKSFAKADHALALEHRSKAAESWARGEFDLVGYELKAAAHGLESAAGWIGRIAKSDISTTATDLRVLGDKLAGGGAWTRDEVARGFESLGDDINALGPRIGGTGKASPVDVGA
jgi:hypothetical protein